MTHHTSQFDKLAALLLLTLSSAPAAATESPQLTPEFCEEHFTNLDKSLNKSVQYVGSTCQDKGRHADLFQCGLENTACDPLGWCSCINGTFVLVNVTRVLLAASALGVPVYRGSESAMTVKHVNDPHYYGEDGFRDADPPFEPVDPIVTPGHAVDRHADSDRVVTRSETHYCTVELRGEHKRGMLVVDRGGYLDQPPNVEIVMDVDKEVYERMLRTAAGGKYYEL